MQVLCREKHGDVWRTVRPLDETNFIEAERITSVRNFLDGQGPEIMLDKRSRFFLVDDVGVIGIVNVIPGLTAHAHITFWDGRLRGREVLCRTVANLAMDILKLQMLWTAIPKGHKTLIAFAKRVGFTKLLETELALGLALYRRRKDGT